MFGLFNSLFTPAHGSVGRIDSAPIRAAVERVVDGVDPRLRAVPHYRRILSRPVEHAVDYLTANVNALPPPTVFDRRRFSEDSRLRALFVGPDHLLEILSFSPAVRGYLQQTGGTAPKELFAALRMERTEKRVLGMALDGDRVLRDVPQTAVNFHNHRIDFPAHVEQETRRQVQERAFDYLIEVAGQHLASIRARRAQLEHQRRLLLQARGRASAKGWPGVRGAEPPVYGVAADPGDDARLRDLEVELEGLRTKVATLGDQLALVARILSEPAKHLRLDRVSLTLDHMNIKVPIHARKAADTLTFNDMLIGRNRRLTIELIRFASNDLLQPLDLVDGAQRALRRAG